MFHVKKIFIIMLFLMCISSLYAQRAAAPKFSMYQYKDKTFSTDTVYGKKVTVFIFGSIT